MLLAQIFSALTVSLCLLIDNIMIGRFLGERALTAYGLANPLLLIIGAVGSMLCAGAQVACSKSLGRGDQEETNVGYSSTVAAAAVFSPLIGHSNTIVANWLSGSFCVFRENASRDTSGIFSSTRIRNEMIVAYDPVQVRRMGFRA